MPRSSRPLLAAASLALLAACSSTTSSGSPAASPPPTSSAARASSAPASSAPAPPQTAPAAGPATADPVADWPGYHGTPDRDGYAPAAPDPSPATALAWTAQLDGPSYASPIVVPGGLVVQATAEGTVFGLDPATGAVRWRRHLADPIVRDVLPCGNIDRVGVIGTRVYDPASGQVFAVGATGTGGRGVKHLLFGIDATTGALRSSRDINAPGADPATHLQRAALAVSRGRVYVAYGGGYGDCGQYVGRVVSLPTVAEGTSGGALQVFSVPTKREAGIWGASGPAVLPGGDLLVTTGNGEATSGEWDKSDSLLRLSPDLRLRDGFAPAGWAQENSVDADLGSTGPVVLPGGRQAVVAGKGGSVFLLDVDHLGGVGGQRAELAGCRSYGGAAAAPAANGAASVVLPCSSGLQAVTVRDGRLSKAWQAPPEVTGSPVIAGSTVWSLQQDGALVGLDLATGSQRASLQVGDATRFSSPAVSGRLLFLATKRGVSAVALG